VERGKIEMKSKTVMRKILKRYKEGLISSIGKIGSGSQGGEIKWRGEGLMD
jgi:hypothetical protein